MQIDEGFDFANFAEYLSHDEFYKWKLNIYFGSNCITELLVENLEFFFSFQVPIAKSHKDRKLKEPKLSLVRLFFQEKLIGVILPLFLFLLGGPWQRFLKRNSSSMTLEIDMWWYFRWFKCRSLKVRGSQQMIHSFIVAKSIHSRKTSKCLNIYTFRHQIYTKKVTITVAVFPPFAYCL